MGQFGLGYEVLSELNPSLIMLSTSMNGQTGPRRKFAGFGTVMAPMSGFSELTGWPDRPPGSPYGAYTDFISPRFTATALLAALDHRRRTGEGQYLDIAQYEASVQLHGPWLLDLEINGQLVSRDGNRNPAAAPHGIYRCADEDGRERWVAIAVEDDAQWAAFVAAAGSPPWALEPRFATLRGRKAHEDDLDAPRQRVDGGRGAAPRSSTCCSPDVPAAPVHDARDLQQDPQIRFRRYFRELDHTVMGTDAVRGPAGRAVADAAGAQQGRAVPGRGQPDGPGRPAAPGRRRDRRAHRPGRHRAVHPGPGLSRPRLRPTAARAPGRSSPRPARPGVQGVAAVGHAALGHGLADQFRVGLGELRPLGQHQQHVGVGRGPEDRAGVLQLGMSRAGPVHGGRVVGDHARAVPVQGPGHVQGGRVADVVGVGLEREPEDGDRLAGQLAAGQLAGHVDHAGAAAGVDVVDGAQERHRLPRAELAGPGPEGADVLGQAAAAEAEAGCMPAPPMRWS